MNNLEQILALAQNADETAMQCLQCAGDYNSVRDENFYHSAIASYKAELLKEVGEPVAYMTTDEEGSASMLFFDRAEALKYSGDDEPVNLFAESQLKAAQEDITEMRADHLKQTEENHALREQLATAEQRVAEACYRALDEAYGNEYQLKAIGEYRKYMKEV